MKIKEIVKLSALLLGREDIVKYIDEGESAQTGKDTSSAVERLTALTNLVISELSTSFVPITTKEFVQAIDGKIYFNKFNKTPLKIVAVFDANDNKIDFEQYPEYILSRNAYSVLYEYLPEQKTIEQDCPYEERIVPSRVLSYGVASEFCITEGEFEQAVMWHKRYVQSIENILLPKNRQTKNRRWE